MFVCHSLGGIITKEALRLSRLADFQPNLQSLYRHTHGVIFLGTPHRGSTWAPWGALAGNLAKLAFQSPNVSLLKSLQVDSMALQMIADAFSSMIRGDIKVFSFREEKPMSGIYGLDGMVRISHQSIREAYNISRLLMNFLRSLAMQLRGRRESMLITVTCANLHLARQMGIERYPERFETLSMPCRKPIEFPKAEAAVHPWKNVSLESVTA